MSLREFKNTKIVSSIGVFIPLILPFIFLFFDISKEPDTDIFFIFFITISILIIVYYIILIIMSVDKNDNISIFPFNARMIYSQYGKYFLIKSKSKNNICYDCYVYENKYWVFLSRVDNDCIQFSGDIEHLNQSINNVVKIDGKKIKKSNELDEMFKKWDGITDDVIRREKTIDNAIK